MSEEQAYQDQPPTLQPTPSPSAQGPAGPWGAAPGAPYPQAQYYCQTRPPRRSSGWRIIFWLFLVLILGGSILLNLVLLVAVGTQFGGLDAQGGLMTQTIRSGESDQTVALYRVAGVIDEAAQAEFKQFYQSVIKDKEVRAVVLRVNSPGGGVTSSDQICEMVKQIKAAGKKVVVSMGSLAASGGYYISAPADEIYAEDTTITGSIGVIAGWFVLKGTMDMIGAKSFTIKSTHAQAWKDEMSPTTMPQDYQLQHLQEVLDEMQARFEDVVKTGRGNKLKTHVETVSLADKDGKVIRRENTEPFNGKIYLASKAKELGLIDQIGYEDAAIDAAAKLASLSKPRVVRYARRRTFMEALMDGKSEASLKIDAKLLDHLQTPEFMMIWKGE
jgi:protease-4